MNDHQKQDEQNKIPSYYNPSGIIRTPLETSTPLLNIEPPAEDPKKMLQEKYPIKTVIAALILIITVFAIPVGVYLNQKPTKVFIEATATPSPTPTPTPTN